jgi:PBP1b-binding outer membrane lipoprotein LpoB
MSAPKVKSLMYVTVKAFLLACCSEKATVNRKNDRLQKTGLKSAPTRSKGCGTRVVPRFQSLQ